MSYCNKLNTKIIKPNLWRRCLKEILFYLLSPFGLSYSRYILGIKIHNRQALKKWRQQGVFLVSNHAYYHDPLFILDALYPYKTLFTAARFNTKRRALGGFIQLMGTLSIDARNGYKDIQPVIEQALEQGHFIHFFPEGSMLHKSQEIRRLRKGVFYLAASFNRPIIPLFSKQKYRCLLGKPLRFLPKRLHLHILEPILPREKLEASLQQRAAAMRAGTLQAMQQIANSK